MAKYLNTIVDMGFHFSNQAHLWHLQTKSHATHLALGEFYEFISEWLDRFAEGYMESTRSVKANKPLLLKNLRSAKDNKQVIQWMENVVCAYFRGLKKEVATSPDLDNLVDEAMTQAYRTKYKLTLN